MVLGGIFINIYNLVKGNNKDNMQKTALSVTMDNGKQTAYTYAELFEKADAFADRLLFANIRGGDRVALVAENSPEWNIAFLAVMKINCTAVLIDAALTKEEILQLIKNSDVRGVFTSFKAIEKLDSALLYGIPVLNLLDDSEPFDNYSGKVSLSVPKTADGDESIAAIIYSSGTTRTAAGIMHTHKALISSTLMCAKCNNLTSEGKFLAIIPNSHIYGVVCSVLAPMLLGADVHFIESISGDAVKTAFAEYRPTIFPGVPKVFELFKAQIIRKIESEKTTKILFGILFPICSALRRKFGVNLGKLFFKSIHAGFGGRIDILCSAGAPMDSETAEFYLGTGFNMLVTYGATETNIPTIGNRGKNLTGCSCGKPYPNVRVKLNSTGELLIKSPYMMRGYFRDDGATAESFEDGWFKTGDLCALDEKGNYKVIGRCKENIVLATGKKVTPNDVEEKYAGIRGIKEFVACGVPARSAGYDEIHVFIVKDNPLVNTDILLKDIQDRGSKLSLYMKIAKVHFVDDVPKTSLQKPKRYLLKKLATEEMAKQTEELSSEKNVDSVDLETGIINLIAKVGKFDSIALNEYSKPFSELGIDSLGAMDLALQIESKYGVRIDKYFSKDVTVAEIVSFIKNPCETGNNAIDLSVYPKARRHGDYTLFRYFCGLARILYQITVRNDSAIPDNSGYIICANHVSYFDYLWLTVNFKKERFNRFCCMAKNEIFNNSRKSRFLAQICGMIPVSRGNTNIEAMNCCKQKLREKWGLLIHPEGTRSDNGELGVLRKGAAVLAIESDVPIIPAYIKGAFEIYPKGKKLPKLFNFRKMRKYPVEVTYGKPIFPQNLTVEELIRQVELSLRTLQAACYSISR